MRSAGGASYTENLVSLFSNVLELAERKEKGSSSDPFWPRSARQILRSAIDVLVTAEGTVTPKQLYELIISVPRSREDMESPGWQASSFCARCLEKGDGLADRKGMRHAFGMGADYITKDLALLGEKTQSNVLSNVTSMLDVFLREPLYSLMNGKSNLIPELSAEGAIIVLAFPILNGLDLAQTLQVIFKYCWQKSMERRNISTSPRPVFLWADEAQFTVNSHDMMFQTVCRSARVATVFITQTINNYYSVMPGERGKAETDALLAGFMTKVFCANADPVTNDWAANLIGVTRQYFSGGGSSLPTRDLWGWAQGPGSTSASFNEQITHEVPARSFTTLKKGGPPNRYQVEAIVHQGGRIYRSSGKTWIKTTFDQRG